ncbi:RluA family pseudouridine synthase [Vibrio fluvialis]|uniref:RluA family pseudouridine synthase n=1 Tax=Vibrio fluvialis TaxID=676 RepID=UPI0028E07067|nr:pseudouridine synthase [Vibrio fluvialis]MDT8866436.1 pseudouridine synthase [Vibrio fluvialis]MDT8874204.1 pseudouridine synthase [Vibrio fluvialis]
MPHTDRCFTPFKTDVSAIALPERFTFPFCYDPHALCVIAADELQQHIRTQQEWSHPFGLEDDEAGASGKMFGVLVVKSSAGQLGYLSAFSGQLAEQNHLPGFVPPVFDRFADDAFFRTEANQIAAINQQVRELKQNAQADTLRSAISAHQQQADSEIEALRLHMVETRAERKQLRAETSADEQPAMLERLAKESVAEKNQLKQLKLQWEQCIRALQDKLAAQNAELHALQEQRKQLSAALQKKLFAQYRFLNKRGDVQSLNDIFSLAANPIPPAGSGECAAPKLLQYAFRHQLTPIAMAEFWWGRSPKSEIRQHKKFYPACQNKCHPILGHMLSGMALDDNPLLENPAEGKEIEIVYQDEAIVVINKPAEFLSVPGVNVKDSALTRLEQQFPEVEGPFVLHRLDMSTSGLLVFALTRRANKSLQKQFITRGVEKRYVALLSGEIAHGEGSITLPLRPDLDDRPRQMVCFEHGKAAETYWQTIRTEQGRTRVYLHPKTGRTHQLRVHCAHEQGFNTPILGDDLYGEKADRLHLHAESLSFDHPYTKQRMTFQVDPAF